MRVLCMLSLVGLVAAIAAGCGESSGPVAYAAFRYTDLSGKALQIAGQPAPSIAEQGSLIRRDKTVLQTGQEAVQELWIVDPMEVPPNEYKFGATPEGLVTVTGGSLKSYVITPPKF